MATLYPPDSRLRGNGKGSETVRTMLETTDKLPDPLVFSDSAASKVRQLIADEENEELMLRVFISGG